MSRADREPDKGAVLSGKDANFSGQGARRAHWRLCSPRGARHSCRRERWSGLTCAGSHFLYQTVSLIDTDRLVSIYALPCNRKEPLVGAIQMSSMGHNVSRRMALLILTSSRSAADVLRASAEETRRLSPLDDDHQPDSTPILKMSSRHLQCFYAECRMEQARRARGAPEGIELPRAGFGQREHRQRGCCSYGSDFCQSEIAWHWAKSRLCFQIPDTTTQRNCRTPPAGAGKESGGQSPHSSALGDVRSLGRSAYVHTE